MARLLVSPAADADLLEIYVHIAQHSSQAARTVVQRIKAKYRVIARHPTIGAPSEHHRLGTRLFPVGSYVVYYSWSGAEVRIERVLHGARDRWNMPT